ncbi:hypothetical protein K1719_002396 [Acacia pycnantha]|nr:hypothetical protein K1719_002396 [Acacia pycnantha]
MRCQATKGADTHLRLFQIDLLDYNSIVAAVVGCAGVFHLTSPCIVDRVQDPQKELLNPAIKGTINVLTAAKEAGVSRVVLTSSISSITPSPKWPYDVIKNEDSWTDIEYARKTKVSSAKFLGQVEEEGAHLDEPRADGIQEPKKEKLKLNQAQYQTQVFLANQFCRFEVGRGVEVLVQAEPRTKK